MLGCMSQMLHSVMTLHPVLAACKGLLTSHLSEMLSPVVAQYRYIEPRTGKSLATRVCSGDARCYAWLCGARVLCASACVCICTCVVPSIALSNSQAMAHELLEAYLGGRWLGVVGPLFATVCCFVFALSIITEFSAILKVIRATFALRY